MTSSRRATVWLRWFAALLATNALLLFLRDRLDKAHIALAFLLVVLAGSAAQGRALGIALAGSAFLAFNWFFLRPYNTFIITDPLDWLVLVAFLVTGVVAAQLLERQRQATNDARERGDEIDRIATLGAETLNAPRADAALDAIAAVIRSATGTEQCMIYRWNTASGLHLAGQAPSVNEPPGPPALLSYTVEQGEPAAERADGTFTILADAFVAHGASSPAAFEESAFRALGLPLRVRGRVVGALSLSSARSFRLAHDQHRVLNALSYYAALGVERMRLADAEEEADALRRADRLKDALLASVSHDLRTPLTAIKAIANEVWRGGDPQRAIIIEEEADRLNAMVEDLLALSQLNAGVMPLSVALTPADDVVAAALERVESAHGAGRIVADIANDDSFLVGAFDFVHTVRALTNVLENALKYSPPGATVFLGVASHGGRLRFTVDDQGSGIAAADEPRIFEPFYRGSTGSSHVRGTGLGLAIARQLIEAQDGTIVHQNRPAGGSRFIIDLPAAVVPTE